MINSSLVHLPGAFYSGAVFHGWHFNKTFNTHFCQLAAGTNA